MTKRSNPLDRFARDLSPGTLCWIGVRSERREPMTQVESAQAIATLGIEGDHRLTKTPGVRQAGNIDIGGIHRTDRALHGA